MFRRLILALPLLAAIGAGSAQAQQCDTRFDFHNRSSSEVIEFYFDRSSRPDLPVTSSAPEPCPPAGRSASLPPILNFMISGQCCRMAAASICTGLISAPSPTLPSQMPA